MTSLPTFLGLIGGLLAVVGVVGLRYLVPGEPDTPTTTGTVTWIDIADVTQDTFDQRNENKQFAPEIRYEYEVDGQNYEGEGFYWEKTMSYGYPAKAKSQLEAYPEGSETTIYYRTDDPSKSCLKGESSVFTRTPFVAALVVGVFALVGAGGSVVLTG